MLTRHVAKVYVFGGCFDDLLNFLRQGLCWYSHHFLLEVSRSS